jgi:hypothetical protein
LHRPRKLAIILRIKFKLNLLSRAKSSIFCFNGKSGISGKSVLAGVLSLIIWPGIGQAVNDEPGKKVLTHGIVGLLPPFRFWSGYDALVDRHGGYWEGKV